MRKYFLSLLVAAPFIAPAVYGLPAPNSLSSREKRAVPPRATPTPVAQRRAVAVSEADRPSTVVVIDAGHGGFDRGGIPGQRVAEKTMTLDVAQRRARSRCGAEICGHTFVDGTIYVLRGAEKPNEEWRIARLDPREETPEIKDLAIVPFACRSLTFDGEHFWANHRAANETVAFDLPN